MIGCFLQDEVSCFPCADGFALKCEGHCIAILPCAGVLLSTLVVGCKMYHFRELCLRAAGEITGLSNKVHDKYSPRFSPRINSNTAQFGQVHEQKLLTLRSRP